MLRTLAFSLSVDLPGHFFSRAPSHGVSALPWQHNVVARPAAAIATGPRCTRFYRRAVIESHQPAEPRSPARTASSQYFPQAIVVRGAGVPQARGTVPCRITFCGACRQFGDADVSPGGMCVYDYGSIRWGPVPCVAAEPHARPFVTDLRQFATLHELLLLTGEVSMGRPSPSAHRRPLQPPRAPTSE